MNAVRRLIRVCDFLNERIGRLLAWFTLGTVVVTLTVVVMRYGFSFGRIWIQEIAMYLHAAVFMLGLAYTLQHRAHVRVDIFYQRFQPRTRALVDCIGSLLFLLPVALFILFWSFGYVANSWERMESSPETGGLPLVYVLKTFIPLAAVLLIVQALAEIARNALVLAGQQDVPQPYRDDDESGEGGT
ncbi:MAG: TRAP transporter small permease subunit [Halofilum sp. (in: g-proteobacteria)]|nr:TRAP transporter small permease subunit [Halofilum sp. (in: g-proteobacteria)]